jgi:hypothetical protein
MILVVWPVLVRNRAFFFFSNEVLRLRQPQVAVTEVPSVSARLTSPAAIKPFLDAFPVPNGPERSLGLAEFAASYSDRAALNATSIRVDTVASDRLVLFSRYNYVTSNTVQRGGTMASGFSVQPVVNPTVSQSLNILSRADLDTETLTGAATFSFSAGVINDVRANWSRARGTTSSSLDDFGGALVPPDSLLFPNSTAEAGFQFLTGGGTNTNLVVGKNVDNVQRQVNLVDNLSLVRGSHQLKFGVDYRRLNPIYNSLRYRQSVVYAGLTGSTGPSPGTVLSGIAKSVQVFAAAGPRFPVFTEFSAYAQDTWRATPRLSLTWGLRWELDPPPTEANGNDPFTVEGLGTPAMTLAPRGTKLWKTTYHNFAPRLGLAYQLSSAPGRESVLRGGIGVFYDLGDGQAAQGFGSVFPFVAVKRFVDVPFPLSPEQAVPPPFSLNPPFGTVVAFDPGLQLPRTYQWNLAVEKSLTSTQAVSVAYVAALGRRLLREDALLTPKPDFSVVRLTRNAAHSDYHAMQIQYERRLSRGLQALASYTWSHSIDNASADSLSRLQAIVPSTTGQLTFPDTDPGSSDFDVRHALTIAATYNVPAAHTGPLGRALLREWSVDAIVRARTATPVNIVVSSAVLGEGLVVELQRPDLVTGVPLYIDDPTVAGGRRINRAAFSEVLGPRQGTLGYNALRGFGVSQFDLALRRQFGLGERLKLQLKVEFFNLFNHPNFGNPVNLLSSHLFGQSTQMFGRSLGNGGVNGGLSPLYQIGGPRSTQLAVKLQF